MELIAAKAVVNFAATGLGKAAAEK